MPIIDLTPVVRRDAGDTRNDAAVVNSGEVAVQKTNVGQYTDNTVTSGQTIEQALQSDQEPAVGTGAPKASKVVKIEGPLSSVYTQALNIAYAKESAADGSMGSVLNVSDTDDEGVDPDLYVYVTDMDGIGSEGALQTFDALRLALDRYKDKTTMVVMEHFSPVGRVGLALEAYSHDTASRLYYRRTVALEAIKAFLEGSRLR